MPSQLCCTLGTEGPTADQTKSLCGLDLACKPYFAHSCYKSILERKGNHQVLSTPPKHQKDTSNSSIIWHINFSFLNEPCNAYFKMQVSRSKEKQNHLQVKWAQHHWFQKSCSTTKHNPRKRPKPLILPLGQGLAIYCPGARSILQSHLIQLANMGLQWCLVVGTFSMLLWRKTAGSWYLPPTSGLSWVIPTHNLVVNHCSRRSYLLPLCLRFYRPNSALHN